MELVDTRDFRPVIDSVLSLDEAPAAIQRLEERGVTGKVIIAPWGQEA